MERGDGRDGPLAASEALFRMAFEGANEGLCIVDVDGRFTRVNEALCRFFGLTSERLLTMGINDLAHPEDRDVTPRYLALALAGRREHFRFEKRFLHASGKPIWGRVSARLVRDGQGRPVHFIAHVLDVTGSRRAAEERALHTRTLEALLRLGRRREASLPELADEVVAMAASLTGSRAGLCAVFNPNRRGMDLLAADPEALAAFGLPPDVASFHMSSVGIDSDDWPSLLAVVGNIAGSGGGDAPAATLRRHLVAPVSDGASTRLVLVVVDKAEPYVDADVGRLCLLGDGVIAHINNHRRERDLERARSQAETANRAKSGFLANMSHEIRTPLSGIIGLTQMALSMSPRPELRENLEMILDSSRSLLGIVNDILDFSKIEAGKMEFSPVDFDLRETLDRTMKPFHFSARQKGLRLATRLDPKLPDTLHGDPDRIMQVVRNLVGNALKFTDKGEVAVSIRLDRPGDPMRVACAVRDTGIGIPAERMPDLFQVFSQIEQSRSKLYGGTGLGLAISRRLVEMMGGTIGVESKPGKGSVFSFTVSLRPAQEARREPAGQDAAAPAGGFAGLKVLLAEDNQVNRLFLRHFLVEAGCEVRIAGSGGEALAHLGESPADVVLMDIQMPEMDGTEATRRIRAGEAGEAACKVPIVALTAYSMKGDRERFLSVGLDDYVSKPVDVEELFAAMRRVLSRAAEGSPAVGHVRREAMDMGYYEQRGKREFALEISRLFLEESPAVAAALATAVAGEDWPAAADQAHSLLGMAVPLRARGLAEDARRLQGAALAGDAAAVREIAAAVLSDLDDVQRAIRDMLDAAGKAAK